MRMKRETAFFHKIARAGTVMLFLACAGRGFGAEEANPPAASQQTDGETLANAAESADSIYAALEKRAAGNDADAWFELGLRYYEGFGCEQPPYEWALRCFRKSNELKPNAEAKMFLELCRRRIAEEKAVQEEKAKEQNITSVDKAFSAHVQDMRKQLGAENVDSVLELLKAEFAGTDADSYPLREVKLPGSLRLAGWNFDMVKYRKYLADNMIDDREGFPRWMAPEFDAMPLSENLLAVNPSIRAINGALEQFAADSLNQTFLPCGKTELDEIRKAFSDGGLYMEQAELSAWKITDGVYFTIMTDYSGAWRLRYYRFLFREEGRYYWFGEDSCMPDAAEAAVIAGYLLREPNSLNNIAVLISENFEDAGACIEKLLLESEKKGCTAASYNLGMFYLSRGRRTEGQAYLKKALELMPELMESLKVESFEDADQE